MKTAVDTNILFDILLDDPSFAQSSITALVQSVREGLVVVCDTVFAELAAYFDTADQLSKFLEEFGIQWELLDTATMVDAHIRTWCPSCGTAFQVRQHVLPDFLIVAHAVCQSSRLLTRDRGFYRQYFDQLKVWDPVD
jgi:hypothetical protein